MTCNDDDGLPAELHFELKLAYKIFSFDAVLREPEDQIFVAMNPLMYHEYWYRPFGCRGDYITTSYDSQHKYKASIEHYYITHIPNEAYSV